MLANPKDIPILSDRTQLDHRIKLEQKFMRNLQRDLLARTKGADAQAIPIIINRTIADHCWGLWLAGIKHGRDHGKLEVKIAGVKTAKFALLDDRDPPSKMQNTRAQDAIWARVKTIASNNSDTQWRKIQAALVENVRGESDRSQLQAAIIDSLGGESYAKQAETIARTELTFAYNAGRVQTYRENGVQAVRRYCIRDERTCEQCAGLNGMVARLDDMAAMMRLHAPSHPNCRCTTGVLLDIKQLAEANREPPPLPKQTWMMGSIVAAIIN